MKSTKTLLLLIVLLFQWGCSGHNNGIKTDKAHWGGKLQDCSAGGIQSVQTNYMAGLVHFRIINFTNEQWNMDKAYTFISAKGQPEDVVNFIPGYPTKVKPNNDADTKGTASFFMKYPSLTYWEEDGDSGSKIWTNGNYSMVDFTLNAGTHSIKISNSNLFTNPPPPPGHPWWDYLLGALDIMIGAITIEDLPFGVLDLMVGTSTLISGAVDGKGDNNVNGQTINTLVSKLTGSDGANDYQPLNGGTCGGDVYTIADNGTYVIEVATAKTALSPPEVHIYIYPYATYFAKNALIKLDEYRKGTEAVGTKALTGPPYSCVYQLAFADGADTKNNHTCSKPTAYPGYSYMGTARNFSPDTALDWWNFANQLPTTSNDPVALKNWVGKFPGYCGTPDPACPKMGGMTIPVTDFRQYTWAENCDIDVTVNNPDATVILSPAIFAKNRCAGQMQSCTVTLQVDADQTSKVTFTDGTKNIPVSASCITATKMRLPGGNTYSSGVPTGGTCSFVVPVQFAYGAVTATPSADAPLFSCQAYPQGNSCKELTSSCSVTVTSFPNTNCVSTFDDGKSEAKLSFDCKLLPSMTLPNGNSYSARSPGGGCFQLIPVANAFGPVTITVDSCNNISCTVNRQTCTDKAASCQISVQQGYGNANYTVTDGITKIPFSFGCQKAF